MEQTALLTLVCCCTIHFMMTCVLALYARYKVQYLSLTWIMGLFAAAFGVAIPFASKLSAAHLGMLHPILLLSLVATSYLQSIYPLSIALPGYLQWGRMWRYATPALVLIGLYVLGVLFGSQPVMILTADDLLEHWLSGDIMLRAGALGLTIYHIVNIFRIPHLLVRVIDLPGYLKGYATVMGLSAVFYVTLAIWFDARLMLIYMVLFTLLNLYLFFRTLETMAINLPKPKLEPVTEEPTPERIEATDKEDFNEANRQRFQRVQYFMQNHHEWTESTFGRDRLCEATGINRHLMLQCLRSQGFNNTHEYINSYRIEELKRLIKRGGIGITAACSDAGFGSPKTARSCFERSEGITLDEFLRTIKPTEPETTKENTP